MPEQLQESSDSGQTLQDRIDGLESWISELESVDADIDEELADDKKTARVDEIVDEITQISSGL